MAVEVRTKCVGTKCVEAKNSQGFVYLSYRYHQKRHGEQRDAKEDRGEYHTDHVGKNEEQGSDQPWQDQPTLS